MERRLPEAKVGDSDGFLDQEVLRCYLARRWKPQSHEHAAEASYDRQ